MLVYHPQTLYTLKYLNKDIVPVYWKWNKEAWVTQHVFNYWYTSYFYPTVFSFCEENKLPPRVLLLLDSCPSHPKNLDEIKILLDVKVVSMLPNTTSRLQSMDHRVITTFKAYYLRNTFMEMMGVLDTSDKTIEIY